MTPAEARDVLTRKAELWYPRRDLVHGQTAGWRP